MSGRAPKFSEVTPEDRQREHDKDPFRKLKKKPGVTVKNVTRRRA